MKLKVCGMRSDENIRELMTLKPDYMGMIFYPKSSRYVDKCPQAEVSAQKVGVFVNASHAEIVAKSRDFGFNMVQLHGNESIDEVKKLKASGFKVIKVFSVESELPLEQMLPFEPLVDYFLFDTRTPDYGGSGRKFDWSILSVYTLSKPFFLSGGIDIEDIELIKNLDIPQLHAVDINSRFELEPALKDIEKIKAFKDRL